MSEKTTLLFEKYDLTKIFSSDNGAEMLVTHLLRENVQNLLICSAGLSTYIPDGGFQSLMRAMGSWSPKLFFCNNIPAEPATEDVRRIVEAMETHQADCVLAIGGGSVMDAAKAAYLSFQSKKDVTELFGVNKISSVTPESSFKRVICVPTTSGTGSEATPYSNIVDKDSNVKKLIVEKAIIPQLAFLSPSFTKSMPRELTVTTALDALVHSIESLLNNTSLEAPVEAEEWALESIKLIAENLPLAIEDPEDLKARKALSEAAALGGMCITHRPTSLPHLASFSLYGKVTHGQAVAALLPGFWRYYAGEESVGKVTMKLAGIFSSEMEKTPEEIIEHYVSFVRSVGGAPSPGELGLDKALIEKIASDALLNPVKLQSCPRKIDMEEASGVISGILEKAW